MYAINNTVLCLKQQNMFWILMSPPVILTSKTTFINKLQLTGL